MNKKFSTLMASLLLAGGVLSNVSAATTLEEAAKTPGMYYKMLRVGQKQSGTPANRFQGNTEGFSLEYIDGKIYIDNDAQNGVDYWRVSGTAADGFVLTNQKGKTLTVKTQAVNENGVVGEEYTNLTADQWYVIKWETGDQTPYALIPVSGTEYASQNYYYSAAFNADATTLHEVGGSYYTATDFFSWDSEAETYEADGKTYRIYYFNNAEDGIWYFSQILKAAYNKDRQVWTFSNNTTGAEIEFGGEADFEMVQVGDDAVLKLKSGKGYAAVENGDFKLVDSIEKATVLAFVATNTRVPVSVDVLNYYEKDGFTVEINGYDAKDEPTVELAGNPFSGHLTPMVLINNSKFEKAADQDNPELIKEYYLKNEAGNYIVAMKYDVEGQQSSQALYNFTTVTEKELLHNIARANNGELNDDQIYFGKFRASVDEAALDKDETALDEITWLEVNIDPYNVGVATDAYAELGRVDIKNVPTLVAVYRNSGFYLKPIHISLQAGNLVDWKEFLQAKFYTVEKIASTDKTAKLGKLTARYNTTDWTTSYGNDLEGQFALTVVGDKYVFTNRETLNSVWNEISIDAMYSTDKEYTYKYAGETYVIKPVAEVKEDDGYKRYSDSDLNRQYRIAFSSAVFDSQAYLTENHADTTDPNAHVIGLETERDNALVFNMKKYSAERNLKDEQSDHSYKYHPTDSIYVISKLGFYNTKTKKQEFKSDTLKVVTYSFVNQYNEPLMYGAVTGAEKACYYSDVYKTDDKKEKYASLAEAHEAAQKFAVRYDNNSITKYNLRPVALCKEAFNEKEYVSGNKNDEDLYQEFAYHTYTDDSHNDWNKMYAGDATLGILANTSLYDRTENDLFVIEETESEVYRRLANNVDTVSIYRNYNEKSLLYEKTTEISDDVFVNFLGMENIADFTKMAPAMIADTAYVRNETYKPQYMLIVDPTIHPAGKWCDVCNSDDCEHAVDVPAWTEGRILVNLVDSAKAWDEANKHQVGNPYKNTEGYYKLGFVQATHRKDSLIVNGKRQFIGNNDNHIAKFQFRYADTEDKSFVIETSLDGTQTPGYLKWMNGVVVVVDDIKNADIYNMNEDESRTPTANETIATGNVVVAGVDGAVVVKGAEGKNVIVSTILGKVVANEVVSSDNATIAAPAGVVVVSVDGESFKVVVK